MVAPVRVLSMTVKRQCQPWAHKMLVAGVLLQAVEDVAHAEYSDDIAAFLASDWGAFLLDGFDLTAASFLELVSNR